MDISKKIKIFFKKTFKLFIVIIFVLAHYILISYELIYLSPDIVRMEDSLSEIYLVGL